MKTTKRSNNHAMNGKSRTVRDFLWLCWFFCSMAPLV